MKTFAEVEGDAQPADAADDTVEAEIAYPPLTTVRQPLKELGSMAVGLLFRLMAEQWSEPLHVELATRLVERESTAPAVR